SLPEQHACFVSVRGAYRWVDCADIDVSMMRRDCYELGQQFNSIRHAVQKNETVSGLATEYAWSEKEIAKACGVGADGVLRAGSTCRLQVPGTILLHQVERGETLESISEMFSMQSADVVRRLNCLAGYDIQ